MKNCKNKVDKMQRLTCNINNTQKRNRNVFFSIRKSFEVTIPTRGNWKCGKIAKV